MPLVGRVPCGERVHVVGGRISLKIEEDGEIRFRDIPQADLDPSGNRLLHPNLASTRSDRSGPLVLFFAGDVVAARQPPRQRPPRNSGSVPARPQRHGALALTAGPLLHESNHAGANPSALTLAR